MHLDLDAYPLLTASDERRLAQRIERGDERALEQLVGSNLRLVVTVAARHKNRHLPMADLIQEGSIGLLRAAQKFDWRRGLKFSTYAVWWIEQAIVRALDQDHNAIRLPSHVGYNQRRAVATQHRLREELGREPSRVEIAKGAGISLTETNYALDAAHASVSLNEPTLTRDRERGERIADESFGDPDELVELLADTESVYAALAELDDDERQVIEARFGFGQWDGEGLTDLDDVGRFVAMTPEHVNRCLSTGLAKLEARLSVVIES